MFEMAIEMAHKVCAEGAGKGTFVQSVPSEKYELSASFIIRRPAMLFLARMILPCRDIKLLMSCISLSGSSPNFRKNIGNFLSILRALLRLEFFVFNPGNFLKARMSAVKEGVCS
jgi:hypothetical protein